MIKYDALHPVKMLIRLLGTFSGEDIEMFMKLLPRTLNIKAILRKLVVK